MFHPTADPTLDTSCATSCGAGVDVLDLLDQALDAALDAAAADGTADALVARLWRAVRQAEALTRDPSHASTFNERTPASEIVGPYADARLARGEIRDLTHRSITSLLRCIFRAMGDPPISSLSRPMVLAWLEGVDLAPATTRTRLSALRTFCRWAVEEGLLATDPTAGVRGPREPRRLPRGLQRPDVRKVLGVCPDPRSRLIVLLMVQEGLRRSEVAGLQIGDVDRDEHTLAVTGKGGHQRLLPLSEETRLAMVTYLEEHPATAGPLIRSYADGRSAVSPATIGRLVTELFREAGIKAASYDGRSAHALRHTMAGDMLRGGAHIRDVQAALGHVSLMVTQRYLPLVVNDLRDAMGGRSYRAGLAELAAEPECHGRPVDHTT